METDSLRRHLAGSRDRSITVPGYFSHRCTAPEFPETFLAKLNIITKGRHCLLQKNKNNINKTQIPGGWMVALPEHPEFPFSLGPMQPQHPGLQSELQKRDLTSSPSEAGGFFIVQEYKTTVISVQGEEKNTRHVALLVLAQVSRRFFFHHCRKGLCQTLPAVPEPTAHR